MKLLPLVRDPQYQLEILYTQLATACMSGDEYSNEEVRSLFNRTTALATKLNNETKLYYSYHYMIHYYETSMDYKRSYELISDMYQLAISSESLFGLVHSKSVDINTASTMQRYDRVISIGNESLNDIQKFEELGYGGSVQHFEKLVSLYIAEALVELDRFSEAVELYQSLNSRFPDTLTIRYSYVEILLSNERWSEAEEVIAGLDELNPSVRQLEVNRANIARRHGELLFHQHNFKDAIPLLETFINSNNVGGFQSANASTMLLLAKALAETGEFEQSTLYFSSWSEATKQARTAVEAKCGLSLCGIRQSAELFSA